MRRLVPPGLLLLFLRLNLLTAQAPTRDWRPEDRTIIGDFSRISAIAASMDRVYIVAPSGILIWNPPFQHWEGIVDPPEPGVLAGVFTALADPLDNSLWMAAPDHWIHYQPDAQLWEHGPAPDGVIGIAFDRNDPSSGLYLRSRAGWLQVPRGGAVATPSSPPAQPITPATINDAVRANPSLQANAASILTDNRLRSVRYTAAARSVDNRGWFLGTSGLGALYLPDGAAMPQRLSFGLPSAHAGAVFSWPDGVWVATDRTTLSDASLTFVGTNLDQFHSYPGTSAFGTPFTQVREMAGQGRALWAATDLGVARVEPSDSQVQVIDERRGLPDSRVYSIVSRNDRIVVGTAHGVARVSDSLRVERIAPNYSDAVFAVFPSGDSIWAGTPIGVLLALPNHDNLVRPAGMSAPSLQVDVVDLAPLGDTLVALTFDQLLWRNPGTGQWTLGPNLSALLGRLRRFAADGPGFWIAGDRGVGFARLTTPAIRSISEGDLPGAANDVAVDQDYLWVATDGGLVRFRLSAIRP